MQRSHFHSQEPRETAPGPTAVTLERPPIDTPISALTVRKGNAGSKGPRALPSKPPTAISRLMAGADGGNRHISRVDTDGSGVGGAASHTSTIQALHFPGVGGFPLGGTSMGHSSDSAGGQVYRLRPSSADSLLRSTGFEVRLGRCASAATAFVEVGA